MIPFIQTNNSMTFVLEGVAYTIPKDYGGYAAILSAINEDNETSLSMILHKMATKDATTSGIGVSLDMQIEFELDTTTNEFIRKDAHNICL